MLVMQMGAFAGARSKKAEEVQGGSSVESSMLRLENGTPHVIPIGEGRYFEIMLEANFGHGSPEITFVAFPRNEEQEPIVFRVEAKKGTYNIEDPQGEQYNRMIASLSVLEVSDAPAKYVEVSLSTYFERPQKFRFEGLPRYVNGVVEYTLQLNAPQNVTVSLCGMSGAKIDSQNMFLGEGTFDLHIVVNKDILANQLLFLVADFEKYGAISKTINMLGGSR